MTDEGQSHAEAPRPTCPTDDMRACLAIAIQTFPAGKQKDEAALERALALASVACKSGYAPACERLGTWIDTTTGDARASCGAYIEACELGDRLGCRLAAVTLLQSTGEDIVPEIDDLDHAVSLLTRACEANDCVACLELAALYAEGRGVTQDKRMAKQLEARSEELGCAE